MVSGNSLRLSVRSMILSSLQAIGFEAPSADSLLSIPSQSRANEEINVGVSWSEGLGKYKLTKVVTLAPRFIIRNDTLEVISFREHAVAPRGRATLSPGERCPLQFMRAGEEKLLTLAFSGLNAQWFVCRLFFLFYEIYKILHRSAPINVEDIGSVHLRLKRTNDSSEVHLICADVKLAGSTIFIVISRAEESWPYAIENDSDYSFTFYQSVGPKTLLLTLHSFLICEAGLGSS